MIGVVSYFVFFATTASILAIAVLGLNPQWGNTGLFNGGVVAFFGAGAYGTLILGGAPQDGHLGGFALIYPLALLGGMIAAGILAWIVGLLTLRLRHDYLAIATFGVAVAFENVMRNAEWLAGGAKGIRGFERPLRGLLGGFIVGLASNLALVVLPSGYTPSVPFLLIILVLMVRPHGLFGEARA